MAPAPLFEGDRRREVLIEGLRIGDRGRRIVGVAGIERLRRRRGKNREARQHHRNRSRHTARHEMHPVQMPTKHFRRIVPPTGSAAGRNCGIGLIHGCRMPPRVARATPIEIRLDFTTGYRPASAYDLRPMVPRRRNIRQLCAERGRFWLLALGARTVPPHRVERYDLNLYTSLASWFAKRKPLK